MLSNWSRLARPGVVAAALLAAVAAGAARAGETRCWIDHGALVVPAAFGDIAGDFILDLAAPGGLLHVTRAGMAGHEEPAVTAPLRLAGATFPAVTLTVADLDARTRPFGTVINGVIGADALRAYVVELNPDPCRLRLVPAAPARAPARGALRLTVTALNGRPTVQASVTDGVRIRAGGFALGTGAWESTVVKARLARPAPTASGPVPPSSRLRGVEVAGTLFEQVPARPDAQAPGSDDAALGVIGLSVWSHWRLRLDQTNGVLDLTPAQRK